MNYVSASNIREVIKFYNLGNKNFEIDLNSFDEINTYRESEACSDRNAAVELHDPRAFKLTDNRLIKTIDKLI